MWGFNGPPVGYGQPFGGQHGKGKGKDQPQKGPVSLWMAKVNSWICADQRLRQFADSFDGDLTFPELGERSATYVVLGKDVEYEGLNAELKGNRAVAAFFRAGNDREVALSRAKVLEEILPLDCGEEHWSLLLHNIQKINKSMRVAPEGTVEWLQQKKKSSHVIGW